MTEKTIIAYRLTPVYAPDPMSFGTACLMECAVTGRRLSSSGGGPEVISPQVREKMLSDEGQKFFSE